MLPYVAESVKMSLFAKRTLSSTWSPCASACSCVVCQIYAHFDVFLLVLAVFPSRRASFASFSYFSDVTLELETYLIIGIVFMTLLGHGLQSVRKLPVTISNQRLGPVGQYSSQHPWPREVFHPWGQNGSVAMSACPERFTHFFGFLHLS